MLARFQEKPTHFSSQSDLFSDDKFWQHFRKRFNFGSKNQHPWTALWSKGLWEEETPSVVGWGRFSQGNAYSPTPVAVAQGWLGTTRAFAVAGPCPSWVALCCPMSSGWCLLRVLGTSVRCFGAAFWCWARSLAPCGPDGKCLERSVFC